LPGATGSRGMIGESYIFIVTFPYIFILVHFLCYF
jgi:hypothetical protein